MHPCVCLSGQWGADRDDGPEARERSGESEQSEHAEDANDEHGDTVGAAAKREQVQHAHASDEEVELVPAHDRTRAGAGESGVG